MGRGYRVVGCSKLPGMPETVPILASADFDETLRFYSTLGFLQRSRSSSYLALERPEGFELHFWLDHHHNSLTNTTSCFVRFESESAIRALYDEWAEKNTSGGKLTEPSVRTYGMVEFALVDPHGNLIRVAGPIGT